MGRKKRKKGDGWFASLREETVEAVTAIVFILAAIFLGFAAFDSAGFLGSITFGAFKFLFGVGYYLLPLILLALGIRSLASLKDNPALPNIIGGVIIFLSGLGLVDLIFDKGGFIGGFISGPLEKLLDFWVALIALGAILLGFMLIFYWLYNKIVGIDNIKLG